MKKKGPYTENVFPIEYARAEIAVELHCSICKENYVALIRWNASIDKLRCRTCVNPVELIYPPKWRD